MQKVINFPLTRIILAILFVGIGVILVQVLINLLGSLFPTDNPVVGIFLTILALLAVYLAYAAYVRLIEKRPMKEFEGTGALRELGLGLLIGLGLFSLIILILWILGSYHVTGVNPWLVIVSALLANVPSGFIQEIIFRGVIFRIIEDWLGPWWALGISSVLFGIIHVLSASASVQSLIAITLEAGVLLGAAYLLTHRLWLPIGIHVAWDIANDGIFGVGSAGISGESIQGLLQATLTGPAFLSGGAAGVEASLVSVIVLLAVSIYMLGKVFQKTR
jgi:hypothetical protein